MKILTGLVLIIGLGDAVADPVSTGITYQGELLKSGLLANGPYDFQFELWDSATLGTSAAGPIILEDIPVADGVFTVELDFGDGPYVGEQLWLEIGVRDGGSVGGFTGLLPRQKVTATPYSLRALMVAMDSVSSSEIVDNTITASDLATNSVTADELADGAVDSAAVALPLRLTEDVTAVGAPYDSATVSVRNSSPGLGTDNSSPYGIVGITDYSGGSSSPLYKPPAGVYGEAGASGGTGIGVLGLSGDTSNVQGVFKAGVQGLSDTSHGVSGSSNSVSSAGVRGRNNNYYGGDFQGRFGLRARSQGTSGEAAYGANIQSENYRAMYVEGGNGWFDAYFGGNAGINTHGIVDRSAALQSLALNLGNTAIGPGDLVALAGVGQSPEGGQPMLGVAKLSPGNEQAIIGVAQTAFAATVHSVEDRERVDFNPVPGGAAPGGYLTIITHGLAAAVKIDPPPGAAPLAIGVRLALSASGRLARYTGAPGEVRVGKVAGPLNAQKGTVPVFIDLD